MKSRFDVVVHGSALYVEVSLYRTMDLKYGNNNCEINFIEPSRDRHRKTTRKRIWKSEMSGAMRRTTNTWKQRKKTHRRVCCSVDWWNMKRDVRFEFVHVLEAVSDIDLTVVNPSKHSRGQSGGFREAMLIFPYVGETIVELLL